jgi:predicted metalloendopeptidase
VSVGFCGAYFLQIYTIVREVRDAFQREVAVLPWLDEKTKGWVIEKASDIETNIGYVDWVDDATLLDKLFEDVSIVTNVWGNYNILTYFT